MLIYYHWFIKDNKKTAEELHHGKTGILEQCKTIL